MIPFWILKRYAKFWFNPIILSKVVVLTDNNNNNNNDDDDDDDGNDDGNDDDNNDDDNDNDNDNDYNDYNDNKYIYSYYIYLYFILTSQIITVRGTTPARHADHVCKRECSNLARIRPKAWRAYQCDAHASQYAITHVGTQADQMRRTEIWDILNLIIVYHVTYLAVFSQSEIRIPYKKFLNISITYESVLFFL